MKNKKTKPVDDEVVETDSKAEIKSKIKSSAAKPNKVSDTNKLWVVPVPIVVGILVSLYYNQWLAIHVNMPHNEPKIVGDNFYLQPENQDRYWGTYRQTILIISY